MRPTLTTFFTLSNTNLTAEVYRYVASNTDSSYAEHMFNLIYYGVDPCVYRAFDILEIAYGRQDPEIYVALIAQLGRDNTETFNYNTAVMSYCVRKLGQLGDVADKPQYILPDKYSDYELEYTAQTMVANERVIAQSKLLSTVKNITPDIPDTLAKSELLDVVRHTNQIDYDENLFLLRAYGPAFPAIGINILDSHSSDLCQKYGGCRMLLCNGHTPLDTIFEEDDDDWYTGRCAWGECETPRISSRHMSCRMPLETGGWHTTCYCCWEHVRLDLLDTDRVTANLVDYFEELMLTNGLYDRYIDEQHTTILGENVATSDAEDVFAAIQGIYGTL